MTAAVRTLLALLATASLLAGGLGCTTWQGARLYQSGTRALEAGDVPSALDDLQQAARLVPEASEVQNHLGLAWLAAGDEARAFASFERAVQLDCDNAAAHANLEALETRLRERAIRRVSRSEADDVARGDLR
jgi:Flp pilus assembly protein TadD